MAKRDRQQKSAPVAAPATTSVQQPERIDPWLEPYQNELGIIDRFLDGDQSAAEEMRAAFGRLLADPTHKGTVDGELNRLVVQNPGVIPSSLLVEIFGGNNGGYKAKRAEEYILCAREAGTTVTKWGRGEACRVIEAWLEKNPAQASTGRKRVAALLSGSTNPAAKRFPLLYQWAYEESRNERQPRRGSANESELTAAMERARLESQIADLETRRDAAATAKPKPDYVEAARLDAEVANLRERMTALDATDEGEEVVTEVVAAEPTLEDQIADLETKRDAEATKKNYAEAARLDDEVTNLRTQLEASKQVTATPTPQTAPSPTPTTEAPAASTKSGGINTVDDAEAYCEANMKGGFKRAFERWNSGDLTDEAFVAKVRDFAGTSRATA